MNLPFGERDEFRFVKALTAARRRLEHATCALPIREPPPSLDQWFRGCISGGDPLVQRHLGLTVSYCGADAPLV